MEKIRKLLDQVEVLPLSPTLLPKLLPKLSDVDTNFDEVVEIIAHDPSLTSKLLQICNSAYFGQESEVSSVSEAVNRVGYQAVYLLVAMINGSTCFAGSTGGLDAGKLWRHSITAAFNSKFVAESSGLDGNLLFTAGLLHDLGKVILAQDPDAAHLYRGPSNATCIAQEEQSFDCNHADVGAALLERWKLPTSLTEAVRYHHAPASTPGLERTAACVALGNLLSHGQDDPEILRGDDFKGSMALLGTTDEHLNRWHERMRDHQALITSMSRLRL